MISLQRFATREAAHCLLCEDAPCDKACTKGANPSGFIRSFRFEHIKEPLPCGDCAAPCEKACIHPD